MQCNAALIPRCIYPIDICDDKWLGYLACIGQTLVQKKRINSEHLEIHISYQ